MNSLQQFVDLYSWLSVVLNPVRLDHPAHTATDEGKAGASDVTCVVVLLGDGARLGFVLILLCHRTCHSCTHLLVFCLACVGRMQHVVVAGVYFFIVF